MTETFIQLIKITQKSSNKHAGCASFKKQQPLTLTFPQTATCAHLVLPEGVELHAADVVSVLLARERFMFQEEGECVTPLRLR